MPDITTPNIETKPRSFECPHCGAYARQYKGETYWLKKEKEITDQFTEDNVNRLANTKDMNHLNNYSIYRCESCGKYSIWKLGEQLHPKDTTAPDPHDDLPTNIHRDYNEAAAVVDESPRAAAALLRLAIEKLVAHLGAEGGSLHQQIGDLVERGEISSNVQKALDSVRVIGNESVHPGVMDMEDDRETVTVLFKLINIIVEETIAREKMIDDMYSHLPENKKEGIDSRDS
ncbi:DUF4145 domain-containing protein [Halorubrum sodomense]|uniref:DUF4145 domain-containing protein n=1 Tax=Halorubrum sodomense TaxID=35743 RepID=A0A1I6FKB2_HALSD|nr:DUF4145 domain-containing protein [Halorubrum sodomense]SFR30372.1 protein of unknown function [Halorubrum sodomense]